MKKNKPIAGYHILMILSAVDGKFSVEEDLVIEQWLEKEFPLRVNLDKETEYLSKLKTDDYIERKLGRFANTLSSFDTSTWVGF